LPYLQRATALFPGYADRGSPRELLAVAYRTLGDTARAIEELRALTNRNAGHYEGLLALADLLEATGDSQGAAEALDRSMYVYPLDAAVHRRLAEFAEALEDWPTTIRERRALVALRPVDRAEALYDLARAYFMGRDLDHARSTVLAALDIAPAYPQAQDLLLEIHEARRP
jgi:tetratricopeptide (TPR) repeat protein